MENSTQIVIDKLNHLIAIAEDGKEGYTHAASNVKYNILKGMFEMYAIERSSYIIELREEVEKLGYTADLSGGPLGALHRTWIDMKSIFTSGNSNAIIEACITGEEAAIDNYRSVLRNKYIADNTRYIVETQLSGIEKALCEIKLKMTYK